MTNKTTKYINNFESTFAVLLTLPFLLTALTLQKSMLPWLDEVMFIDPAVNLAEGKGFVSSAWPYQNASEFFLGNAPLYSYLNSLWIKGVGFGILESRLLNFTFISLSVITIWFTIRESSFIESPSFRLATIPLMLSGAGVFLSYNSARYDGLNMLIMAGIYYCLYSKQRPHKTILLLLLGTLIPLAGFHLVVLCGLLFSISFYTHRKVEKKLIYLALSIGVGIAILFFLAAYQGLLQKFILMTFGSQHTFSGQIAKAFINKDYYRVAYKLIHVFDVIFQDRSFFVVFIGMVLTLILTIKQGLSIFTVKQIKTRICILLFIPLAMYIAGKFAFYYSWIIYFPCIIFAMQFLEILVKHKNRVGIYVITTSLLTAIYLGIVSTLPLENIKKNNFSYNQFETNIKSELNKNDIVYSDFSTYFAARSIVNTVFVETYGKTKFVNGIPEHRSINILIINEKSLPLVKRYIPGNWVAGNTYQTPQQSVTIYRRKNSQ